MICTRGQPRPGSRDPRECRNTFIAFAIPFVWVIRPEVQARGAHILVSDVPRIPPSSVDPTVKNFHWGDLTRAMFEARDAGADNAVLLDAEGNVTEGPGFNVMCIIDGKVISPIRGALEGVTRASVFELCSELGIPTEVRDLHVNEFREADEIFTCTTAGGIMPASRLDGRIMNNDAPGPISARLRSLFWDKRAEGWHATPVDYSVAQDS